MEAEELKSVLRAAQRLARSTAPLQRQVQADVERQRTEALLRNYTSADEFLTPTVNAASRRLLPHQKDGVRWLLAMHARQQHAIVADDMGLGKTVQVLAFLSALVRRSFFGSYLVVVPLSTLDNWAAEASAWLPWMNLSVFRGDATARTRLRARLRRRHRHAFAHADSLRALWGQQHDHTQEARVRAVATLLGGLVLATYESLMADKGALARLLPWDIIVVDEAQRLKRMDCSLLRQLRKARPAAMRVILTGTPVQNNAQELWTLLEYVAPQYFHEGKGGVAGEPLLPQSQHQQQQALVPAVLDAWVLASTGHGKQSDKRTRAKRAREADTVDGEVLAEGDSTPPDEAAAQRTHSGDDTTMHEVTAQLHAALAPFVLRRTKADTGLALPPKVQILVPTPLTAVQRSLYGAVATMDAFANNRLMHLRRCCLYPGPLVEQLEASASSAEGTTAQEYTTVLNKVTAVLDSCDPFTSLSSKLQVLSRMLPALHAAGHRVLLFSQFTSVLDVLEDFLSSQLPALTYVRLDGSTAATDRAANTLQFQATPPRPPCQGMTSAAHTTSCGGLAGSCGSFLGNVENGVADDDTIFATPPPSSRSGSPPPPSTQPRSPPRSPRDAPTRAAPSTRRVLADRPLNTPRVVAKAEPVGETTQKAFLFLISTRTGGAGLNLTAADTVLLFDGDFNPQNDLQAIDRCHRIGQRRPVVVYRLLCPHTVEADQLVTARRKLRLEAMVLRGTAAVGTASGRAIHGSGSTANADVWAALPRSESGKSSAVELKPIRSGDEVDLFWGAAAAEDVSPETEVRPLSDSQLSKLMDRQWVMQRCLADTGEA